MFIDVGAETIQIFPVHCCLRCRSLLLSVRFCLEMTACWYSGCDPSAVPSCGSEARSLACPFPAETATMMMMTMTMMNMVGVVGVVCVVV
jgi:hypothetical protein